MKECAFGYIVVAALLAGCGGPQPPIGAPGMTARTNANASHGDRTKSWMLPEARSEKLLYVFTATDGVYVLSYPRGKQVGHLTEYVSISGACADAAGNVWIVNVSPPEAIEYAHGSTSEKATLSDAGQEPQGCSIDTKTGNLAIVNYDDNVAVYEAASGAPTLYTDADFSWFTACTYDNAGNLFVVDSQVAGKMAELPYGSTALDTVTLSEPILPSDALWDGQHLAFVDLRGAPRGPIPVDQIDLQPSGGQVIGTTRLDSPGNRRSSLNLQYAVVGNTIVGPDRLGHRGMRLSLTFWNYPKGGKPTKVIDASWSPDGAVISAAAKGTL